MPSPSSNRARDHAPLRQHLEQTTGRRARRQGGIPEWRLAGERPLSARVLVNWRETAIPSAVRLHYRKYHGSPGQRGRPTTMDTPDKRPGRDPARDLQHLRRRATSLVTAHHADPAVCPRWLADQLHVSLRHLYRAFEGSSGLTRMLNDARVGTAHRLLRAEPSLTVSGAAVRAGFTSLETFRLHVHRRLGVSPSQLRDLPLAHGLALSTSAGEPGRV